MRVVAATIVLWPFGTGAVARACRAGHAPKIIASNFKVTCEEVGHLRVGGAEKGDTMVGPWRCAIPWALRNSEELSNPHHPSG